MIHRPDSQWVEFGWLGTEARGWLAAQEGPAAGGDQQLCSALLLLRILHAEAFNVLGTLNLQGGAGFVQV